MKYVIVCTVALALSTPPLFAQETLKAWEFNTDGDAEGWIAAHSLAPFTVQGGALRTEVTAGDPYLHTSQGLAFDIEGNDFQYIEVRMKLSGAEMPGAEFFWANTVEGKDQGFVAGKERGFRCTPDGEWHTYFVYPLWQGKVPRLASGPARGRRGRKSSWTTSASSRASGASMTRRARCGTSPRATARGWPCRAARI